MTDLELKREFLNEPRIELLEEITDKSWVASAALAQADVETSYQSKDAYLSMGIRVSNEAPAQMSDRARSIRKALIDDHDLCQTYRYIYPSPLDESAQDDSIEHGWDEIESEAQIEKQVNLALPPELNEFLATSLEDLALQMALTANLVALRKIYEKHGNRLTSNLKLHIAASIPEYVAPEEYMDLVPLESGFINVPYLPWRTVKDWSELDVLDPPVEPIDKQALAAWFKARLKTMDEMTNLIDAELTLVQFAASRGISEMDELGEDLSLLAKLIYESSSSSATEWTLVKWQASTPEAIFQAYLEGSTPRNIVSNLRSLALPYAFVVESKMERQGQTSSTEPDTVLHSTLLRNYLFSKATAAEFPLLAAVFESSKPILPHSQRLIESDQELTKVALACLYGSAGLDGWQEMGTILGCLPAFDSSTESSSHLGNVLAILHRPVNPESVYDLLHAASPAQLSSALDYLDLHLDYSEVFARWNAPVPLIWFLENAENETSQLNQATKMVRQAGQGSSELESEDEWESLKDDLIMMTQQRGELSPAFGKVNEQKMAQIFFHGILANGKFNLCKRLFESGSSSIDTHVREALVLNASMEMYENSESGHLHSKGMRMAYECLEVATPSPRIKQEKDFIEATSRLTSFNLKSKDGEPLSPIEIKLTKDKLTFIARILASSSTAYAHPDVLLELIQKLGYHGDKSAEMRVLAMVADSALQATDFEAASDVCERLIQVMESSKRSKREEVDVQEAENLVWTTCFQIGKQSEYQDIPRRMSLLGRALLLCPPNFVESALNTWRTLESSTLSTSVTYQAGPRITATDKLSNSSSTPKVNFDSTMHSLGDSARHFSNSAASYLRSSSPQRQRQSADIGSAFDSLLSGREGGVRDTLSRNSRNFTSWLIGEQA